MKFLDLFPEKRRQPTGGLSLKLSTVSSLLPKKKDVSPDQYQQDLEDLANLLNVFYDRKGYRISIKHK